MAFLLYCKIMTDPNENGRKKFEEYLANPESVRSKPPPRSRTPPLAAPQYMYPGGNAPQGVVPMEEISDRNLNAEQIKEKYNRLGATEEQVRAAQMKNEEAQIEELRLYQERQAQLEDQERRKAYEKTRRERLAGMEKKSEGGGPRG